MTSNQVTAPPAEPSRDTSVHWVTLGQDHRTAESTGDWSGRRVAASGTATALAPAGEAAAIGSTPRPSDALPIR